MARPLRIEYARALYHVTARGNAPQDIYFNDEGRAQFLAVLSRVVSRFHLLLHVYSLMDNHFHRLVETPGANLSKPLAHRARGTNRTSPLKAEQITDCPNTLNRSRYPGPKPSLKSILAAQAG